MVEYENKDGDDDGGGGAAAAGDDDAGEQFEHFCGGGLIRRKLNTNMMKTWYKGQRINIHISPLPAIFL